MSILSSILLSCLPYHHPLSLPSSSFLLPYRQFPPCSLSIAHALSIKPPYFLTNSSGHLIHLSPLYPPFSPKVPKREDLIVLLPHPPTSPQDSLVTMTTGLLKAEVKDLVAMASASPPPAPPARSAALAPAQYAKPWFSEPRRTGRGFKREGGKEAKG